MSDYPQSHSDHQSELWEEVGPELLEQEYEKEREAYWEALEEKVAGDSYDPDPSYDFAQREEAYQQNRERGEYEQFVQDWRGYSSDDGL